MTYAKIKDLQAALGIPLDDTGTYRPSLTNAGIILNLIDGYINGQLLVEGGNIVDKTGLLRSLATSKAIQFINNTYAMSNPEAYSLFPIEFTKEELKMIHKATRRWDGISYEIGS